MEKFRNFKYPSLFILFPYLIRSKLYFQIVLLTNRDLKTDALLRRADCTVIERADAPTAKQVAVIWVQDKSEAPLINGTTLLLLIIKKVFQNDLACLACQYIIGTQDFYLIFF